MSIKEDKVQVDYLFGFTCRAIRDINASARGFEARTSKDLTRIKGSWFLLCFHLDATMLTVEL